MSWRRGFGGLGLFGVIGCAGAPPSAEAPSTAPEATASAAPVTSALSSAPMASASAMKSAVPATAALPPPDLLLGPICQAKCDKLSSKCAKVSIDSCRLNCGKYEPPPTGCGAQVQAALECARDAKDLTCANVAPESCAGKFKAIFACSAGEDPTENAAPVAGLPAGWEKVEDPTNGFSIAMPNGSHQVAGPDGPIRSVTAPNGTLYTVSVLPLLTEKPSEKSLLHFLMKVQGRCSDKVKLDGFVEKEGGSSIHYTAHCPDKTDWDGMIYIGRKHLFLLSAQAAAGKVGATEPFFYQVELTEH